MHYIQFKDGVPLEVHKFQNLSDYESNFYVWTPPKSEHCYEYKNGKRVEKIYAFLFPLTTQEKQDCITNGRRYPIRLETTVLTLELIFEKERPEYGFVVRKVLTARLPFYMVTDHGVFRHQAVLGNYTCEYDTTLGDHDSVIAATYVDNIVDTLRIDFTESSEQELKARAIETGVLGEYFVAKTPPWYAKAVALYGVKDE